VTNPMDSHMTNARVEVITSVERRRRWSRTDKERIVAATLEPGAVASEIARQSGIHVSQLYRWRRELCERRQAVPAFAAVAVATEAPPLAVTCGVIEIEFATGARLRITGSVDVATVSATIAALIGGERRR
jgi:transposase